MLLIVIALVLLSMSPLPALSDSFVPYRYKESFESGELNAWASYPPCQDTAYDPYVYPGKIQPRDTGKCYVAEVSPPWNRTQLLGAMKRFNFMLDRSSTIYFKYFIKTIDDCSELTVHIPASDGSRYIYSINQPATNTWLDVKLGWDDLAALYTDLKSKEQICVTALVVQVEIPDADPGMAIYFGLDDITVHAMATDKFAFSTPQMYSLTEWDERIPKRHYRLGEPLVVDGTFETTPDNVELTVTSFIDRSHELYRGKLINKSGGRWMSRNIQLKNPKFMPGFYRGTITALQNNAAISETTFSLMVVDGDTELSHPRLLYDSSTIDTYRERMQSKRFEDVRRHIREGASAARKNVLPEQITYDFDQFPTRGWLESIQEWAGSIREPREALFHNALAYSLLGDRTAGEYCREVMLALSRFPQWNHPWMENRGFHTYYPLGQFVEAYALTYDLVYDMLTEDERREIRTGMIANFVKPAFDSYVIDDQVTSNSSNWISHIVGGSLVAMAALYGDGDGPEDLEPWLSGNLLKQHTYIEHAFGRDGSYGEGFRYFNYAMQSFAKTLPIINRIFHVDFSGPMQQAHLETLWATNFRDNVTFSFGDTEPHLKQESTARWIGSQNGPMNSWAWLLERTGDPVLFWLYGHLKEYDTIQEVLHDTGDIPVGSPDTLGTVKFFRDVGTAVFKSGWGADDFMFVFRSGPFYNHQHMDQGSFFLADHGRIFLEERYDGEHHYYDDPIYRTHTIQAISHNTILIDRNPQSQKTGDPAGFAPGMNDHAVFAQWLDAESFSFAAGNLEHVYYDELDKVRRNVLFIKPRTILLVDEIHPAGKNVEASLLFHSKWKDDIAIDDNNTVVTKDNASLFIYNLIPSQTVREVVEEPHQKYQYAQRPLRRRGYLQVSAQTHGAPLTMATLMTATADGSQPPVDITEEYAVLGNGGKAVHLAVAKNGTPASVGRFSTDGIFIAWNKSSGEVIACGATGLSREGKSFIETDKAVTIAVSIHDDTSTLRYHAEGATVLTFKSSKKPRKVILNKARLKKVPYNATASVTTLNIEPGDGIIEIVER
ncbi:heparinase II/III family protein [Candidatus Latescibacterota bacterium]